MGTRARAAGIPIGGGGQVAGWTPPFILPYDPILIVQGDSQARGTYAAGEQAAAVAAYTVTDKVKIRNGAGAWVDYTPGTVAGIMNSANDANVGPELGFIERFRAAYPENTLYIVKTGQPGSFQSRGASVGTVTGSSSGTVLTVESGSVSAMNVLFGTGVPSGLYAATFSAPWQLGRVGLSGYQTPSPAIPSGTVMTRYNGYLSWSVRDGVLFEGSAGGVNDQHRARVASALSSLPNGRVVGVLHVLGSNDMSATDPASRFSEDLDLAVTRMRAAWNLSNARILLPRVPNTLAASGTVRAAQNAKALSDPMIDLIETDDLTRWDGLHWNLAGGKAIGSRAFDIAMAGGMGVEQ
jgi:hypothetical protein